MDLTHLPLDQIAGALLALSALAFLAGIGSALVSASVLWTYAKEWITKYMLPSLVLVAVAAVGGGIPEAHVPPNPLVGVIFGLGSAAFVASTIAAIATNLGVDPTKLPRSQNAPVLVAGTLGTTTLAEPILSPPPGR